MKWISFKKEMSGCNAYLTVFLALSLTIILSLCLTLIEGVRKNGARFMSEYAMDVGMNSILAEYHRELLKQYDVFFVDTSYGSNLPSLDKTAERLRFYMDGNLSCEDSALNVVTDLYGLYVQDILIGSPAVATDDKGSVFRKQAIEYMYDKYGFSILKDIEAWEKAVVEYELDGRNLSSERENVEGQINAIDGSEIQVSEEEWIAIEVDNPADQVNVQRNKEILLLAMRDTDNLSDSCFDKTKSASARKLNQGQGIKEKQNSGEFLQELLLFDEYLLEKCSYYGQESEKSHMKYQIEYILAGKDNDLDNLTSIAARLIMIREAANAAYLFSNEGKRAQAALLAAGVAAVALVPELQTLLEYSILFAWAFAESVYDVRSLFDGGKIPLLKTDDSWHTGIDSLFDSSESNVDKNETGLSYTDYLRVFLKLERVEKKTMRLLDMAELDIRKTAGNENFRIDGCIDGMTIEAVLRAVSGYSFIMQRDCCYE